MSMRWHEFEHEGKTYCATTDTDKVSVGVYSGPLSCAPESLDYRSVKRSFRWYGPKGFSVDFRGSALAVSEAVEVSDEYRRDLATELEALDRYDARVTERELTQEERGTVRHLIPAISLMADVPESDVRITVTVDWNSEPPAEYFSAQCSRNGRWDRASTSDGRFSIIECESIEGLVLRVIDRISIASDYASSEAMRCREAAEYHARRDTELKTAVDIVRKVKP